MPPEIVAGTSAATNPPCNIDFATMFRQLVVPGRPRIDQESPPDPVQIDFGTARPAKDFHKNRDN